MQRINKAKVRHFDSSEMLETEQKMVRELSNSNDSSHDIYNFNEGVPSVRIK